MSKFDIPIEQREAGEEAEGKRRELLSSNQQCESCERLEAMLEGMTDTAVKQDEEIERLRAALKRVDELMIRERQSNKGYVREVRRVVHDTFSPAPEPRDG